MAARYAQKPFNTSTNAEVAHTFAMDLYGIAGLDRRSAQRMENSGLWGWVENPAVRESNRGGEAGYARSSRRTA
jgi:hypothetical protein